MYSISCKNISKGFYTNTTTVMALRDIALDIYKGEFLMLVGPSGCGKTTLISIMAGILKQDGGTCHVLRENLINLKEPDLLNFRAHKIGFIFQSFNLIPTLTILENIAMPLIINGLSIDDSICEARKMLERVGLEKREHSKVSQLSGGEQQRIAIARSLVHKPSILICDEPTSALDHATGVAIMDLLQSIQTECKTTLVIVTHDPRIYSYADRIAHMDDGSIIKIEVKNSGEKK